MDNEQELSFDDMCMSDWSDLIAEYDEYFDPQEELDKLDDMGLMFLAGEL
jgi:hypothetical protein